MFDFAWQDPALILHRRSWCTQDRIDWRLRKPRLPKELTTVLGPRTPACLKRGSFIGRDRSAASEVLDKCIRVAGVNRSKNDGVPGMPAPHDRERDDQHNNADRCDPHELTKCEVRHH